jgi:hypothetical protein
MQSNLQSTPKFISLERFPRLKSFPPGGTFSKRRQTKLVHRGDFELKLLLIIQRGRIRKSLNSLGVLRCSHVLHKGDLVNKLCISIRCLFGDLGYDVRSSLKERSGQWQSTG